MTLQELTKSQIEWLKKCKNSKSKIDRWVYKTTMKKIKKRGKKLYIYWH
jgi:ferritin-like metal-binding protein YciE